MKRALIAVFAFALAGCECGPIKKCKADGDCEAGGVCQMPEGYCVTAATNGGGTGGGGAATGGGGSVGGGGGGTQGGGTGGGGAGGGGGVGGGGGTAMCTPACGGWQTCGADGGCEDNLADLHFVTPAADLITNDAGVAVELAFTPGTPTPSSYPAQIAFQALGPPDGGSVLPPTTVSGVGNFYSGIVGLSAGDGEYVLTGSYGALGDTRRITLDTQAPALMLSVEGAPTRTGTATAAWHRDEIAHVVVAGSERIQNAALTLGGSAIGVTAAALASCPNAGALGCDAGTCACFAIDLAAPQWTANALSQTFPIDAHAEDLAGNLSTADAGVAVTRLRWQTNVNTGVGYPKASPAIGKDGTVFVGTSTGITALDPSNGAVIWDAGVGDVQASPAYGEESGNAYLFVAANVGTTTTLWGLNAATGAAVPGVCGGTGQTFVSLTLQQLDVAGQGHLAATVLTNKGAAVASLESFVPALTSCPQTTDTTSIADGKYPGNLVSFGSSVWLPTATAKVRRYDFASGTWGVNLTTQPSGFPVDLAGVGTINALALLQQGTKVAGSGGGGAGVGQVFQLPSTGGDGGTDWRFPAVTNTGPAGGPAIGLDGGEIYFGFDDGVNPAVELIGQFPASVTATVASSSFVQATPVLGTNNLVYSVSTAGRLIVSDRTLGAALWFVDGLGTGIEASPNLGCNKQRPSGPGLLYVAVPNSPLMAIIVDSDKLDSTADWPKYQHDAQNTGNFASTTNLDCP